MQLHYITLHYTTLHHTTLRCLHHTTTTTTLQLHLQLHYFTLPRLDYASTIPHYSTTTTTLHYTTPHHYTTLRYTTLHHTTLHYTNLTTPQLQLQLRYTYRTALQLQLHYATLQLQLRYTLHPAEVTATAIATTPKSTTPTTFRSISGFALPSIDHNNSPLLQCPIIETSATSLLRHYW